jgi:hypothetical protein
MPIEFDWENDDQTVLRLVAIDPWNWNDFHKNMRLATFWLDTVDHPVELIVDLRRSETLPAGALGHIRSLGKPLHPNMRSRLVMIGLDASVAGPLGGAAGIYQAGPRLIHFVQTNEEAQSVMAAWLAE